MYDRLGVDEENVSHGVSSGPLSAKVKDFQPRQL
jgi:hypothetical protein